MLTVNDSIYQMLRQDIFDGIYAPGGTLRQEVIASRYGVSRVPVREAMARLEGNGLVEVRPRRGFVVRCLSEVALSELFDLRKFLELYAIDAAGLRLFPAGVDELAELYAEMNSCDLGKPDGRDRWAHLNRDFHTKIFSAADLKELPRIYRNISDTMEYYTRLDNMTAGSPEQANKEHWELIEAIRENDIRKTKYIITQHCDNTRERLRQQYFCATGKAKAQDE